MNEINKFVVIMVCKMWVVGWGWGLCIMVRLCKAGENFVEWLLSHLYVASREQTQSTGLATRALCAEPSRQPGFLILRNQMWTRIRILSNSVLLGSGEPLKLWTQRVFICSIPESYRWESSQLAVVKAQKNQ